MNRMSVAMDTLLLRCSVGVVALLMLMPGCSELKDELPATVQPGVQAHGPEWVDTTSPGFHGTYIANRNGEYQSCLTCHGFDFNGGTSGVSCITCHQAEGASFHGRGVSDPSSPKFHGKTIRAAGWNMQQCQSCHGVSYAGGRVNASCRDCHTGNAGPENCATCHGSLTSPAPPRDLSGNTATAARGVGAHQKHIVGGTTSTGTSCAECHVVPGFVYAPGHVDTPSPAELNFGGALANVVTNEPSTQDYDASLPLFAPNPSYDNATGSCSNTYCHGNFKNGNTTNAPVWNAANQASQASCGTCHGDVNRTGTLADKSLPKTSADGGTHPTSTNCSGCHAQVVSGTGDQLRIISTALHMNGKLNVFGTERDY